MTEQKQPRLPVKSDAGDTLALISIEGIQLWSKRKREWQTFTIETLLKMHTEVVHLVVEQKEEVLPKD